MIRVAEVTASEHAHVELVRRAYKAFEEADVDFMRRFYADNIVWHVPGRGPVSGTYRGQEQVFGFLAKLRELLPEGLEIELHDVLANDEHAVSLHRARGRRGDKVLDNMEVLVSHIKDGRVVEVWSHVFDQYANDEFWS